METLAMHISNGIIDGPVAAIFAALALAALTACVLRGRRDLDDRLAPMAGLVAAFIFAVQMLNFPIFTAGVSGHLLGGALAAMLVGPWVGALCVAVVLVVQALIFGDGGVAMLGLNITNMALLGTAAAYVLIALLLRVLPRTRAGLAVTAFVAAHAQRGGRVAGLRPAVLAGRHHRPGQQPDRPGRHDGRRPPADRHRRGPDHRDHSAHRREGAPRPGVRAALPAHARRPAAPAVPVAGGVR